MSLPQKIDKCTRSPECVTKVIFQDDEGNLLRFDPKNHEFVPHVCSTKGASKLPSVAYTAEWYNTATGRTRFIGPERMRKSVEIAPKDEKYRKRGSNANPVWEHKGTYISDLDWRPLED